MPTSAGASLKSGKAFDFVQRQMFTAEAPEEVIHITSRFRPLVTKLDSVLTLDPR